PPWLLLGGVGVGRALGPLPAGASASLRASRLATGTAVFGMARQVGAAIGVAVLVALLADPTPAELFSRLQRGWAFSLGAGVATSALALGIGAVRMRPPARAVADRGEIAIAEGGAAH